MVDEKKKEYEPEKVTVTERDILGITIDTKSLIEMLQYESLSNIRAQYQEWKKDPRVEVRTIELTFPNTFWEFIDAGIENQVLDEELVGYIFSTILLPFFDPIKRIQEDIVAAEAKIEEAEKESKGDSGGPVPTKH
jgi:hypothetical protein